MIGLIKTDEKTLLDPSYAKIFRAFESSLFTVLGNNAVFDGGGSQIGLVSLDTTPANILIQNKVFKYSSNGLNAKNDYFGFSYTLPNAFKNGTRAMGFQIKTVNLLDDELAACVKIVGGLRDGFISEVSLRDFAIKNQMEVQFDVPNDATSIKLGFRNKSTNTAVEVYVDNIYLAFNAFEKINIVEQETINSIGAMLSTITGTIKFNASYFNKTPSLFTYNSSTGYFYATKKMTISGSFEFIMTTASTVVSMYKNGSIVAYSSSPSGSGGYYHNLPFSIELNVGDAFLFTTGGTLNNANASLMITATATSENIKKLWNPSDRIGETIYLPKNVAPSGFISAMGSIIGKSSGTFQGADYYNLYAVLWNLAQTTAGEPYVISSAKGTDALTDWNAGKTIKIDESGLFTRAAGGNAGTVGLRQQDAFQGHLHQGAVYQAYNGANGSYGWISGSNKTVNTTPPVTDGTNGTPRTSSETRPTNIAKYVFIRYTNAEPTILAIPNSTQQDYFIEAMGNSGQTIPINTTDIPFILTSQKNLSWDGSGFIAPIDGMYSVEGWIYNTVSGTTGVTSYINGIQKNRFGLIDGNGKISGNIYLSQGQRFSLRFDNGTAWTISNSTWLHWLRILRINGKNDSAYCGEVAKNQVATLYANPATVASVAGSFVDLTWDGVLGDISIVSMTSGSANFTLQKGEYLIESEGIAYRTDSTYHNLYNNTTTTPIEDTSVVSSAPSANSILKSGGKFSKLTIHDSTSFKIRQYSTSADAAGFGSVGFLGKRAKLQITKLLGN